VTDHVSTIAPPLALGPQPPASADIVLADGWWPELSLAAIRAAYRIDAAISDARLREAVRSAIAYALMELAAWQAGHVAAGVQHLLDLPGPAIDGEHRLALLWRRAIASLAKAEIAETMLDYDATGQGQRSLDAVDPSIAQLRRDAAHALADMAGRPRVRSTLL
jgi:hypothetical protein